VDSTLNGANRITCFLKYGDYDTRKKAIITIPVTQAISTGEDLDIYIAKV
jgi:hypothetical protein